MGQYTFISEETKNTSPRYFNSSKNYEIQKDINDNLNPIEIPFPNLERFDNPIYIQLIERIRVSSKNCIYIRALRANENVNFHSLNGSIRKDNYDLLNFTTNNFVGYTISEPNLENNDFSLKIEIDNIDTLDKITTILMKIKQYESENNNSEGSIYMFNKIEDWFSSNDFSSVNKFIKYALRVNLSFYTLFGLLMITQKYSDELPSRIKLKSHIENVGKSLMTNEELESMLLGL
jgi:hypothetical protein